MNIGLSFYNTTCSIQMVRHTNSISFWTVNNNCNVPPVKRCVVFYSDFACLSIHARHNISIWNIASIEMMDEKLYIKIWLVRWQSLESESENLLYYLYRRCIWKTTCNFYISSRPFGHFKTELGNFILWKRCAFLMLTII